MLSYSEYQHLAIDLTDTGVLSVTINRPEQMNMANVRLHWELGEIWRTFERDPDARVAVITGAGKAFSAGADLSIIEAMRSDPAEHRRQYEHTGAIVENLVASTKPIIAAINGVAVGAGLAVAMLADFNFMARSARFTDGHAKLGIAAGDHAAMVWPLLCGMSRAKYLLMTADFVTAEEAERIGLVTRCVDDDALLSTANEFAERLAKSSQVALRSTKRALNQWYRLAFPVFQESLALEMTDILAADAGEGVAAFREKREPQFPSATGRYGLGDPQ